MGITLDQTQAAVRALGYEPDEVAAIRMTAGAPIEIEVDRAERVDGKFQIITDAHQVRR